MLCGRTAVGGTRPIRMRHWQGPAHAAPFFDGEILGPVVAAASRQVLSLSDEEAQRVARIVGEVVAREIGDRDAARSSPAGLVEPRRVILEALERTEGNRSQAAKLLGTTRRGLAMKMERLEITYP